MHWPKLNYKISVRDPNLLKIALQYVQHFNGLIITFPFEKSICNDCQVNDGEINVDVPWLSASNALNISLS